MRLAIFLAALLCLPGCLRKAPAESPKEAVDSPGLSGLTPDFMLPELSTGDLVQLSALRGKVVLLDFWATWCPPCRLEIPHFIKLRSAYRSQGFEIIGISVDQGGPSVVKSFAKAWKINYPLVLDAGAVAQNFKSGPSIPASFLIGRDGRVLEKYVGYHEEKEFEAGIVLALKQPANRVRKAN